ncbi:YdcF family protein [uncultured Clostridium sp.]|uniref:YdcF family protein n=1 Tax=uncultured Clostridium sp. TaxID=59620 RepID=UPI00262DE1AD|nr:YdcF family protein [uncultured Clostridium sp.]
MRNLKLVLAAFICFIILGLLSLIGIVFFIKKRKKIKNKKIKVVGWIFSILVSITILGYLIFEGIYIYHMATYKDLYNVGDYRYEIILGGGLNGDKPGSILEKRLNLGIDYLNLYKNTKVIVSGGQGPDEIVPEAVAMKNYLIEHGIKENRIIEENKSRTTVQNIAFSKKILKNMGAENEKVVIVTDDFHLYRAQLIADELGVKNTGIACKSNLGIKLEYVILACPETIKSLINGLEYL